MIRVACSLMLATGLALPALAAGEAKKEDKAIQAIDQQIAKANVDKSSSSWKTHLSKPTQVEFDASKTYVALMETNKGPIKIKLMPDVAPMHVTSFIYLSRLGFYDDLTFHRVLKGFMAQGGDPLGNGTGGPGYSYGGEFSPQARHDVPGVLSMANAGPNTDGSQFFITFRPTPSLDGKHTVYGKVIEGMENLKKIEAAGTEGEGRPPELLKIEKVTIQVR
ncbi:MAG TPA: peptidylprolyl isomerase [Candidatus Polarisedimenticolaceae bacterium]|nr:peptidylprolyl isomerase [Candidatus Polarisedimenticolaceae bacterium]